MQEITEEDVLSCWGAYHMDYFLQILNGEYSDEEATNDLRGLIGSKYDSRVIIIDNNKSK